MKLKESENRSNREYAKANPPTDIARPLSKVSSAPVSFPPAPSCMYTFDASVEYTAVKSRSGAKSIASCGRGERRYGGRISTSTGQQGKATAHDVHENKCRQEGFLPPGSPFQSLSMNPVFRKTSVAIFRLSSGWSIIRTSMSMAVNPISEVGWVITEMGNLR